MSISYCLLLFASLIICTWSLSTNSSLITRKLSLGSLVGKRYVSERGTVAYLYLGVPFAEPPIGALRYRRPVAKKPWSGVYNATEYKFGCQSATKLNTFDDVTQSEDCLQLNIFVSEHCLRSRSACAVIYYVFGGAFVFNSALNLPIDDLVDNFVSRNIILVTTNYRLAALGWFNTGQKSSAVKNAALWDMIEGLRFVQREIGTFGGDRDRVTLMGHSSGSVNCDQLAMTPLTKGLFSQAILLSGPAGLANTLEGHNYNTSRLLAIETGCATEDSWINAIEDVLDCLRSKNTSTLIDAQIQSQTTLGLSFDGPTIDDNEGDQALIPLTALQMQRKRAGIRLLVGGTNKEFQETKMVIRKGKKKGDADSVTLPLLYYYCAKMPEFRQLTQKWAIARACVDEYRTPERAIDLSDDIKMYVPIIDSAANTAANGGQAYIYSFEYEYIGEAIAGIGPLKKTPENTPKHVDDVVYLIGLRKGEFTPKDVEIQRIYSGLFADFVNYGDPSPINQTWNKFDSDKNNYFLVDFNQDLKMPGNRNGYHQRAFNFWTKTAVEIEEKQSKDKNSEKEQHKKFFNEFLTSLVDLSNNRQHHSANFANTLRMEAHRLNQLLESNDMKTREKPMLASLMRVATLLMEADDGDHGIFEPNQIDINHRQQQLAQAMLPTSQLASLPAVANSSSFFWIAIIVIVVLVLTLAVTCTLLCRNYTKRRQYERFV